MKAQTKITKARFVVSPFTARQMVEVGQSLITSNFDRWDRGVDAADGRAPGLTAKYARFKSYSRRKRAIRDLDLTGRLRASIQVLSANENKVTIGPVDGVYSNSFKRGRMSFSAVLTANQRRWRMWGVSPADKAKLLQILTGERPLRAQIVRAA